MTMGSRAAERYFQQVKSWIPCAGKMKKDVLAQIWDEIGGYLEENPDAGEADLRQRFGTPSRSRWHMSEKWMGRNCCEICGSGGGSSGSLQERQLLQRLCGRWR